MIEIHSYEFETGKEYFKRFSDNIDDRNTIRIVSNMNKYLDHAYYWAIPVIEISV